MVKKIVNKTINDIKHWFNRLTVQGLLKVVLLLVILYLVLGIFYPPTIEVVTQSRVAKTLRTAPKRASVPTTTTRKTTAPRTATRTPSRTQ